MYVYIQTEKELWTVGFYTPQGTWIPESDHASTKDAAFRVSWLNGGCSTLPAHIKEAFNTGDDSYHP